MVSVYRAGVCGKRLQLSLLLKGRINVGKMQKFGKCEQCCFQEQSWEIVPNA